MTRGGGSRKGNETFRDGQKKSQRRGKEIARDDDRPSSPVQPQTQPQTAEPLLRDARRAALNAARSSHDTETPTQSNVVVGVRGSSRPFDPLPANRRLDAVFRHGTFLGEEVPSYFLQAIKKLNIKFWPRYVSIDRDVIENIWKCFLGTFNLVDATEEQAKYWFEKSCNKKWKDFLTKSKRKAILSTPAQTVDELPLVPRSEWCHSDQVWQQYINHWMSEKQKAFARIMSPEEFNTAHVYILCNTPEVQEYLHLFHEILEELNPEASEEEKNVEVTKHFSIWFRSHVQNNLGIDSILSTLSIGPSGEIKRYKGYYVNGYYFDIRQGDGNKSTYNSGVCVKSSCYDDDDHFDYYGVIEEIWELSYGVMYDKVVLFKCFWYDTLNCMIVHPKNKMVQIKHNSRASKDDPFILASQVQQVYYLRYVSTKREHKQWVVAMKTKGRSHVDWTHMENVDISALDAEDIFQEDQQPPPVIVNQTDNIAILLEGEPWEIVENDLNDQSRNDTEPSDYESDYPDNDLEEDNDHDEEND